MGGELGGPRSKDMEGEGVPDGFLTFLRGRSTTSFVSDEGERRFVGMATVPDKWRREMGWTGGE